jgi:hypothetical protein
MKTEYKKLVEKIKKIVKKRVGDDNPDWFCHIVPVAKYTVALADKYYADAGY